MKILFYINDVPPRYGGGYLRVLKIASRMKQRGLFFKVATTTPKAEYKEVFGLNNDDLFFDSNLLYHLVLFPLYMIMQRNKFSTLYIASSHWFTLIPTLIAHFLRKKVIIGITLSKSDSPALRSSNRIKQMYYDIKNYQFKYADKVFVNSELLVTECRMCNIKEEQIALVNNPVDLDKFHPISAEEKVSLKIELDIHSDKPIVLFVGAISYRKGVDLIPKIFLDYFKKGGKELCFIICGNSGYPESESLKDSIYKILNENNSDFIVREKVPNTNNYYQIADVFLFPTTNEGMPNVVLEAMASECKILCNKLDGITDYILPKSCLCDNGNISTYSSSMLAFFRNPNLFKSELCKNKKRIVEDFEMSSVDQQIIRYCSKKQTK